MKTLIVFLAFLSGCQYQICPREHYLINLGASTLPAEIINPAATKWNTILNREVFTLSETEGTITFILEPDGLINPGTGRPCNGFIYTELGSSDGRISHCEIHIEQGPEDKMPLVVAHELGHCLGLEDEYYNPEEDEDSMMAPGGTVIKDWHTEQINSCWQ